MLLCDRQTVSGALKAANRKQTLSSAATLISKEIDRAKEHVCSLEACLADQCTTLPNGQMESALNRPGQQANIDRLDKFGHTLLNWAAGRADSTALSLLLRSEAQISTRDGEEKTPIHCTVESNNGADDEDECTDLFFDALENLNHTEENANGAGQSGSEDEDTDIFFDALESFGPV